MEQNKYYQPEFDVNGVIKGHENETCFSFQVWKSKDNLLKALPNCVPLAFKEGDIEEPTFMDEEAEEVSHFEFDENGDNVIVTENRERNKFTDQQKEQFRYDEYCQCQNEIDEPAISIELWRKTIDCFYLAEDEPEQNSKHTPGEWNLYNHTDIRVKTDYLGSDGNKKTGFKHIANVSHLLPKEEREANAKLIASAPALLEENKKLRDGNQNLKDDVDNLQEYIGKIETENKKLKEIVKEMLNSLYRVSAMYGSRLEEGGTNREENADWREANAILEKAKHINK